MSHIKRYLPYLLKAFFICGGIAFVYGWVSGHVNSRDFSIGSAIVSYSFATYYFQRARYRIRTWATAKGKVVDLEFDSDDEGVTPIVEFTASDGLKYEFTNFIAGTNYFVGCRVEVLYDSSRPENSQINDWSSLWATTAWGLGGGTVLVIFALFAA